MCRKVAFLISFVLMAALFLASSPVTLADFKLDFNGGNGDNQAGWTPWNNPRESDQDYAKEFSADFDELFTIKLTNADWRNRGQVSDSIPLHDLLDDVIKNSSPFFIVTFQGLAAGTYSITTYHHDTNEDVVNDDGTINITVTDADGTRLVVDHLQQSWGPNPPFVGTVSFAFRSDGSSDVVLDIKQNNDGAGHQEAFLNGFEIDVLVSLACASNPNPADAQTDVPRDVVLGWTPGIFAPAVNGHKVYLSENFNDVNDGIGGIVQDANSYALPQRLDFGTTYYWRVDEVNGPPDYTVYEGSVWSFTTEPVGYPIENITAIASSRPNVGMGPENTINGSGLDVDDLHSKEEADMWLTSTEQLGVWIEYEFDKAYKLHEMWVWNYNQMIEPLVGFGLKDVTIEYSTNGTDYTTLGTTHEFAQAPGAAGYAHNTAVDFGGVVAKYVKLTANSNWGGLPQYGLSEVRFFYIPMRAREPYPDSGATDVNADVTLGFRAGREGVTHDVYVGIDEQALINRTAPVATVTEAKHGPLSLDLGKTYYWRVDEVNEARTPTTWESNIWNFTTREFIVVDDFGSYNDLDPQDLESKRIFSVWVDGWEVPTNGSLVGYENAPFCEQTIVHGGKQSMPFFYNNTGGAAYSEAELLLSPPQDWTNHGIKALSLWFFGDASNTPAQMYVKVDGSKVAYDGDAGNLAQAEWQAWNIDLTSFGVNLQNVTKLGIGIDGNGASGKLFFDDVRLYPSRCVSSLRRPQGDINSDCVVDYRDVEIMANDWLMSDYTIAVSATAPSSANLVAHYTLDNNVLDSSGNSLNGTENGNPSYVAGVIEQAISLDGDGDYVDCTNNVAFDGITDAVTVTAWIKVNAFDRNYQAIVAKGDSSWRLSRNSDTDNIHWRCNGPSPDLRVNGNVNINDGQWHHVAGTYDGSVARLYVDGMDDGSVLTSGAINKNIYHVHIGSNEERPEREWNGLIDDVRIHSRALSEAEVGYLADTTPGDGELYVPVKSPAELYNAEPVNSRSVDFKDFAEMAGQWLDVQLWPE